VPLAGKKGGLNYQISIEKLLKIKAGSPLLNYLFFKPFILKINLINET
jgi:hypothetical protein